jgi:hypothetical protein
MKEKEAKKGNKEIETVEKRREKKENAGEED